MGRNDEAIKWLLDAYERRPQRAEPLYWLARIHRLSGRNHLARHFAQAAGELAYPSDKLFVERDIYEFSIRDELSIASYYTGDYLASERLCRELLADGSCPPPQLPRVRKNLEFARRRAKNMVFGLGTGRCGTSTLAALLDRQQGYRVTHESRLLPWQRTPQGTRHLLRRIQSYDAECVGDVAFYYLNYVEPVLLETDRAKFICLRRDREETIQSYLRWTGPKNHWTSRSSPAWNGDWIDDRYDDCYPKFAAEKTEAIGLYWDHYYSRAESLAVEFPESFRVFPIESLSSERGQIEILQFLGIDFAKMAVDTDLRLNAQSTPLSGD